MDVMQRRALLIVIEGIEHQLKSVKSLLMTTVPQEHRAAPNLEKRELDGYTTQEDDHKIEEELAISQIEREKAIYLEELVNRAKAKADEQ